MISGFFRRGDAPRGIAFTKAYYLVIIVLCMIQSAIMDRETFAYDVSMLRALILMSVAMRSVWLTRTRSKTGRIFILVGTVAVLGLSLYDVLAGSSFVEMAVRIGHVPALLLLAAEYAIGLFIIFYMAFSKGARAYFSANLDTRPAHPEGNSWDTPLKARIKTWEFWRDMGIYFIVFSIVGHWAEILFCRLILLGVFMGGYDPSNAMLWDQWLFPFSAEGIALAMVVLLLHPLKERFLARFDGRRIPAIVCSFAMNLAVCTSIDFLTGMAVNQDYSLWDYRDLPFNFMGQVCLQNSLVYSIAATLIVWAVYPLMDTAIRRLPKRVADGLFFGLFGMYAFLALLYFIVI